MVEVELQERGGEQILVLPRDYRFGYRRVWLDRSGDELTITPVKAPTTPEAMKTFWARVDALADPERPFPDPPEDEPAPEPLNFDR